MSGSISIATELSQTCPDLLTDLGMRLVDDQHDPEHFGDSYADLENADLRVRFVRDKGETFLDVASLSEPKRWWNIADTLSLLGEEASWTVRPEDLPGVSALAGLLRANYAAIVELMAPDRYPQTRKELREVGRRRFKEIVGYWPTAAQMREETDPLL